MNKIEKHKLAEVVLYILQKTGGIDYYHLFKILYFAERSHLAKWGHRITSDNFCALDCGPVPSYLYDIIKGKITDEDCLTNKDFKFAPDDANYFMIPLRSPNKEYISKSALEELDKSINENANLSFNQLKIKSHDNAYEKARKSEKNYKFIESVPMAVADGANEDMANYIQEQIEIDKALQ